MYKRHKHQLGICVLVTFIVAAIFDWKFEPMAEVAVTVASIAMGVYIAAVSALLGSQYAKELKSLSGKERADFLEEKKTEYKAEVINYRHGLEMGYIDQVIQPSETRETIYTLLNNALKKKRFSKAKILRKKHGNIPL